MQYTFRRAGAVAAALLLCSGLASAQNYPQRPIRIIIPYAVGGSTDVVFRILSPKLAEYFGQEARIEE